MKTTIALSVITLSCALSAQAGEHHHEPKFADRLDRVYGSINAGINSLDDTNFSAASGVGVETDYDTGYVITGEVGYNVGRFFFIDNVKLGVEIGYSDNEVDSHSVAGANLAGSDGDLQVGTVMANMYHEYNTGTRFVPYYGLGIGIAMIDADEFSATSTGTALDDDDKAFAYQGTIGANYMLTPSSDIGARYRYTATEGAELTGNGPGASSEDFDYENHAFTVNYTHNF